MFCVNCGAQLPENVKFCPDCGAMVKKPDLMNQDAFIQPEQKVSSGRSDAVNTAAASDQTEAESIHLNAEDSADAGKESAAATDSGNIFDPASSVDSVQKPYDPYDYRNDGLNVETEEPLKNSAMAIAGMVCSLVGLLFSGSIMGILGIVFGAVGLSAVNKGLKKGKGMAMAGIIIGIVDLVFSLAFTAFLFS